MLENSIDLVIQQTNAFCLSFAYHANLCFIKASKLPAISSRSAALLSVRLFALFNLYFTALSLFNHLYVTST